MSNIIKRELKANLMAFIVWTGIMLFFIIVVISVYPSISSNSSVDISQLVSVLPSEILRLFNMDIFNIGTALGWMKTEGYAFWLLLGAIFAAMTGGSIIAKEEDSKTIEFLAGEPVTRRMIFISKYAVGLIYIVSYDAVIGAAVLIGVGAIESIDVGFILLMAADPLILHIMFFSALLLIASFLPKISTTRNLALAVVFFAYLLQILGNLSQKLEILIDVSPFEFVSIRYLSQYGHMNYIYLGVGIALCLLFSAAAYLRYSRKDMLI